MQALVILLQGGSRLAFVRHTSRSCGILWSAPRQRRFGPSVGPPHWQSKAELSLRTPKASACGPKPSADGSGGRVRPPEERARGPALLAEAALVHPAFGA